MTSAPDFYLSAAGEMRDDLASVRACWIRARLQGPKARDHILVDVEPPVVGQPYGLGAADIAMLILSARSAGTTLSPVSEWPCEVYISRLLENKIVDTKCFDKDQIEMIGWGTVFRTFGEASRFEAEWRQEP